MSELLVATDLMRRGMQVFRALSPSCPCDLAVLNGVRLIRVEVRTGYKSGNGTIHCPWKSEEAERSDLLAVVVYGETGHRVVYALPLDGPAALSVVLPVLL